MTSIGIRELKQNASEVIARVARGEWLIVTDRGRPVAQLSPVAASPLDRLRDAGRVIDASNDIADLPPPVKAPRGVSLSRLIIDERRDD